MDKELTCYICCKLFTNPVLLPCGHSLCYTCAEKHYKYYTDDQGKQNYEWFRNSTEMSKNYKVTCPVCSYEFTLPIGGVYGFVKNRIIEKIIVKGSGGINLAPSSNFSVPSVVLFLHLFVVCAQHLELGIKKFEKF